MTLLGLFNPTLMPSKKPLAAGFDDGVAVPPLLLVVPLASVRPPTRADFADSPLLLYVVALK